MSNLNEILRTVAFLIIAMSMALWAWTYYSDFARYEAAWECPDSAWEHEDG